MNNNIIQFIDHLAENWNVIDEESQNFLAIQIAGVKDANEFIATMANYHSDENFYDEIINKLKTEAKTLTKKLEKLRAAGDINTYISALKALRETMEIIQRYNWEMKYSEYETEVSDGVYQKQVAVWEQNIAGSIRNHKVWNVESAGKVE